MTPHCRKNRQHQEAGFTLPEVLVTLALIAMMLAALPSIIHMASRTLGLAEELYARAWERTSLRFIEDRLSQSMAVYVRTPGRPRTLAFSGTDSAVSFVAPGSLGPYGSGLYRFELGAGEGGRGIRLAWQVFRRTIAPEEQMPPKAERLILPTANEVRLRYYGPQVRGGEPRWSDEWRGDDLPALVELTYRSGAELAVVPLTVEMRLRAPDEAP
jgi:prepilin-type N-terminal cleavage/methylation domain-containing protein